MIAVFERYPWVRRVPWEKIAYLILFLAILFTQAKKYGFEPGHHGWVSSHGLAIITHATPENKFIGYTMVLRNDEALDYYYFDRYPFIFSGLMNLLISPFSPELSTQVLIARQLMNVIYFLTFVLGLRLIGKFTGSRLKAWTIALFSFSGTFLVQYKDMVHFDQPALLGFLWLANAIDNFRSTGKTKSLYVAAVVAPILGRGYVNVLLLGLWFLFEAFEFYRRERRLKLLNEPLKCLLLAVPVCSLFLGYNIVGEMLIRDVGIMETSIVKSALARLSIVEMKGAAFDWTEFFYRQGVRFKEMMLPFFVSQAKLFRGAGEAAFTILFFMLLAFSIFRQRNVRGRADRITMLLLALTGPAWLLLMRKLSHCHEYTSIILVGFSLCAYYYIVEQLWTRRSGKWLLGLAILLFALSLGLNRKNETKVASRVNHVTEDFQKIRDYLDLKQIEEVYLHPSFRHLIPGVPFGPAYLLSSKIFTRSEETCIISKDSISGKNLVKLGTERFFLYCP